MKTHYELLGLERTADADAIKKAFRREIARYHPDKVIHLGGEFQEMAATRAAELTVAYKTLTDPALREEYDAGLAGGVPPVHPSAPPANPAPHVDAPFEAPREEEAPFEPPAPASGKSRFAAERADRDQILKRAVAGRVLAIVESLHGTVQTPPVRGFDLVMVPIAKPRFLGAMPPRVLVKIVDVADGAAVTEAAGAAARARVHAGKSPVVVLLFSSTIAPQAELSRAFDALGRQRAAPDAPAELSVVVVNIADWSCRLPPNCSTAVHKLTAQICA